MADGTKTPGSTSLSGQRLLLELVLVNLLDVVPKVSDCVRLDESHLVIVRICIVVFWYH